MATAYSFPPLPPAEVVSCLAELGCTVTEAQLAKPEAEWVGALFEELVCLLVGVSRCAPGLGWARRRNSSTTSGQGDLSPPSWVLQPGATAGLCVQTPKPPPDLSPAHPPPERSSSSRCLGRSTRCSTRSCTRSP